MSATAAPSRPTADSGLTSGAGDVVTLEDGLPGFEQCRRFVVMASPDLEPLVQIQGLDASRPSFLAIDPRLARPDYRAALSDADRERLGADDADVLLWLALVRLDGERLLVNLRAPLVINPRRMLGLQQIEADSPYDTHHELPAV